jgi:TolA-binding protein
MMMKSKLLSALVAGVVLSCALGFGAESVVVAQEAAKVSKASAKTLKAAQDAMNAKKYSDALAKLKEAQGIQGKTPYDEYLTNEMLGFIYTKQQQYGEASKALEAGLGSPFMKPAEQPKRVRQLITLNYQLKNYDKVIELGNRAVKGGYADDDTYTWIGQAYYLKGDYKNAAKFVDAYADKEAKAGKKPKEQTLSLVRNACTKTGDTACTQRVLEQLVTYYPKPEYWQNLVSSMYKDQSEGSGDTLIHVYRLASEVDVLKNSDDYTEYAQLAIEGGNPGEAETVLEKGIEKKVFTDQRSLDKNKRLLDLAKKKAADTKPTLAKTDSDAAASKTGDKDVSVGITYYGYKEYDKAAQALQRGLAKPGVPNPAEARLMLGIAELQAGRKEDARKTFKAVKGNAKLEQLANLWILHSQAS